MKYWNGAACATALVALCVGATASGQEQPETAGDTGPIMQVPAPPANLEDAAKGEEGAEGNERSLFDMLADSAKRRLDPAERAQALLDEIPVAVAVEPMVLADMFTRTQLIHRAAAIDVPLRLEPLSGDAPVGEVWHRGDAPSNRYLGRTGARAASAATATMTWKDGTTGEIELYEARFRSTNDPASLTSLNGTVYCAAKVATPSGERDLCLIDRDSDNRFDEHAFLSERSGKTVHGATVLTNAVPMQTPAPYTVRTEGLPQLSVEWTTCGKDWDLPYYSLRLTKNEKGEDIGSGTRAILYGAYCDKATTYESVTPTGKGARIARLGPAYGEISSKKDGARIELREVLDTKSLYRIESGDRLAPLSAGFAPAQAQLSARQQFSRLPFLSTGNVTASEGTFGLGETFLTSGFRHGYTGVVTEDVKIKTLLSSRSVAGGSPVYGVPAKRTTITIGPYGQQYNSAPAIEREIAMDLVWCLPSREENPVLDSNRQPTGEVKVEWTATCLPDNRRGQHTILQDQSPALAVSNMRMDVGISTNDGPPPVAERPSADFGAPLSFRYALGEVGKSLYTIKEEVLLGDEVTSTTRMVILKDKDGKALVEVAGGSFMLEPVGAEESKQFRLTPMLPVQSDEDARIKALDLMALMRRLLANSQQR